MEKVQLVVKKDKKDKINPRDFFETYNVDRMSAEQIAWGAKRIDDMVKGLYTDEEYNKLKAAGIDPASGIMIDGEPLDFYPNNYNVFTSIFGALDETQAGKTKCQAILKALSGRKLDVIKFGIDENGAVSAKEAVPVETVAEKSTFRSKSSNIFRRFFEALGLMTPKMFNKVAEANKAPRDFTTLFAESAPEQSERDRLKNEMNAAKEKAAAKNLDDIKVKVPEKPQMLSQAQRHAISVQCRAESAKNSALKAQMDSEFFADFVPKELKPNLSLGDAIGLGVRKCFKLTNDVHNNIDALDASISRRNTRLSMVLLFGMTEGHSLDELTAPENSELRRSIGKAFIEKMGTKTFDDFTRENGLELNPEEAQKQYQNYFIEQRGKIEKFYVDGFERMRLEPLDIPDPNNHAEFAQKFGKLQLLSTIAKDIEQTSVNIGKHSFDMSDDADNVSRDRYNAFRNYITNEAAAVKMTHLNNYFSYLANPDFAANRAGLDDFLNRNRAAQGKAAAQYLYEKTRGMDYVANLVDNEELSANMLGLCMSTDSNDTSLANAAYSNFLCTNDPEMSTVFYDENSKKLIQFSPSNENGAAHDISKPYQDRITRGVSTRRDLGEYVSGLGILRESGVTLSEKYVEDIIEKPLREKAAAEKAQAAAEKTETEKTVETPTKVQPERVVRVAEQEEEKSTNNAKQVYVTREEAEKMWGNTEHDKQVDKMLDEMMKEADEGFMSISSESKQKMTFDELSGNTEQKKVMPPKEKQAPSKQMDMGRF